MDEEPKSEEVVGMMRVPFDRVIVIDFETAWASKIPRPFTLSKQTTEEYIRDTRFKAWGLCWKELGDEGEAEWVDRHGLPLFFSLIDWSRTAVLAHNAQFDIAIMEWIYDAHPAFIFDSLSMARALYGVEVGNSLAKLAARFDLPPKGNAVYSTDGILDELPQEIEQELANYCAHDVFLCEEIFKRLAVGYPRKELELIDLTLKMFTRPLLELDSEMLTVALGEEKEIREELLTRLNVKEGDLASNEKFAAILNAIGVTAPTKPKKPTAKTPHPVGKLFAFAKTDALFQQMLNGDNEDVALLCEARLKVKSTQARTRAQRFLEISHRGRLPVPLNYFGTLSMRWSASKGSSVNMQNMKRRSFLRNAIMAPEGYQCVVSDLSQIEPRAIAWLSDAETLMGVFRAGKDPYAAFGATMFNVPGLTKDSHPLLRQSAKSAMLGANYYLGWASFAQQLLTGFLGAPPVRYDKAFAKQLGITPEGAAAFAEGKAGAERLERMFEIPHTCTDAQLYVHCVCAKRIIDTYRAANPEIVAYWAMLQRLIEDSLYLGGVYEHKCLRFEKEKIWLPNGMALRYPDLQYEDIKGKGREWTYAVGPMRKKLHAGVLAENTTSALSRVVMTDAMLRIAKRYPVVLTVHDELVGIVPDVEVSDACTWMQEQMIRVPSYLPGIPLGAETGANRRYGLAK